MEQLFITNLTINMENILKENLTSSRKSHASKPPRRKQWVGTSLMRLKRESAFAAFKRCYIREHSDKYPQLQRYVLLDIEKKKCYKIKEEKL
ncbi:MAG: hypothetical protein OSJ62_16015 [Lachnospiraceae bacterium]|nr:hypothetical protein [Lachnospiraceae bacterium]